MGNNKKIKSYKKIDNHWDRVSKIQMEIKNNEYLIIGAEQELDILFQSMSSDSESLSKIHERRIEYLNEKNKALHKEIELLHKMYGKNSIEQKEKNNKIFISYIREDANRVARLRKELEKANFQVWQDIDGIEPGKIWKDEIRKAIEDGGLFVACFSIRYWSKIKTYMNEELIFAIEQLRLHPSNSAWFIPIRFDNCEIPPLSIGTGRTLKDIQTLDLFGSWKKSIERLILIIGNNI